MDFKKVLLPTDFSRPPMQLLDCLDEFKFLGLEEVILVHVIDMRAKGAAKSYRGMEMELLEAQKKMLENMGLKVKIMVPVAVPNLEIARIGEQEQVSLILIPSHGQGFIKNIYLGSTTNDVIRVSSVPVLVEKYTDIDKDTCSIRCLNKFQKVLAPLDFSIYSRMLLDEITGLAHLIEEVILLTVIEGALDKDELTQTLANRTELLDVAKRELEQLGLKVQTIVERGAASDAIISAAAQQDVTLIMLAKRGAGLIKELLLGSTAYEVARRSQVPTLIIPVAKYRQN